MRSLLILILSCLCVSAQAQQAFFVPSNNGTGINGGGGTAGTIKQSAWNSVGSQASVAVVLTNVSSSNLIVVIATTSDSTGDLTSANMSDGVASYTLDHKFLHQGNFLGINIGCWSRVASASGSLTIVLTPTDLAGALNICAYEISGLTFKAPDIFQDANSSGTAVTTAPFNTSSAGVMIAMDCEDTGITITHTAGSGFSISDSGNAHQDSNAGVEIAGSAEHKSTASALTGTTATLTLGSNEHWAFVAAAYK